MDNLTKLRYWTFKILPLVYDDSLSYYEVLTKVTNKVNELVDSNNTMPQAITDEITKQLNESYATDINNKINSAVNDVTENANNQIDKLANEVYAKLITAIATDEGTNTFTKDAKSGGELIFLNGTLYKVTAVMPAGTNYIIGTNIIPVDISEELKTIKETYISSNNEHWNERSAKDYVQGEYLFWKDDLYITIKNIKTNDILYNDGDNQNIKQITLTSKLTNLQAQINNNDGNIEKLQNDTINLQREVTNNNTSVNSRIDNIIAQSGNDNTEIVDARKEADIVGGNVATSLGDSIRQQIKKTNYNTAYGLRPSLGFNPDEYIEITSNSQTGYKIHIPSSYITSAYTGVINVVPAYDFEVKNYKAVYNIYFDTTLKKYLINPQEKDGLALVLSGGWGLIYFSLFTVKYNNTIYYNGYSNSFKFGYSIREVDISYTKNSTSGYDFNIALDLSAWPLDNTTWGGVTENISINNTTNYISIWYDYKNKKIITIDSYDTSKLNIWCVNIVNYQYSENTIIQLTFGFVDHININGITYYSYSYSKRLTRKIGYNMSILGDSYSAISGYIPDGNINYYPKDGNDVTNVSQMWWYMFGKQNNIRTIVCDAYSGSPVCNDGWGSGTTDATSYSFITRAKTLPNADIILIFGGTNDAWLGAALGDYVYSGWSDEQLSQFRPACAYLLNELIKKNPTTKIVWIINGLISTDYQASITTICDHYSVEHITVHDFSTTNVDGKHPNIAGMKTIAKQIQSIVYD